MADRPRYELLSPGVLTVSPAPGTPHQRASRLLANLLEAAAARAGADVDVLESVNLEIPGERLTMPDILVLDDPTADANPTRYSPETVWLVVEIVSPGSKATDRAIKPDLYAEAGIPTYWRLELEPTPRLVASTLHGGQYAETATINAGQPGILTEPFAIELDPGEPTRRRRVKPNTDRSYRGGAVTVTDTGSGSGSCSPLLTRTAW